MSVVPTKQKDRLRFMAHLVNLIAKIHPTFERIKLVQLSSAIEGKVYHPSITQDEYSKKCDKITKEYKDFIKNNIFDGVFPPPPPPPPI